MERLIPDHIRFSQQRRGEIRRQAARGRNREQAGGFESFEGKYNSHTKGARRACHEKLVTTRIDPGQDPDDFFFILDKCRQQVEDMGKSVHDERYEDIILQALPVEYKGVR